MGDDFTRQVFAWLEQIASDPELSGLACRLAITLTRHFNRVTGEAWPRQQTLASALDVSDRGVRKCLDYLVTRGHLEVRRQRGRGRLNHYRMAFKTALDESHENRNDNSGNGAQKGGTAVPRDRSRSARKAGTAVPPEPSERTIEEPNEGLLPPHPIDLVDEIPKRAASPPPHGNGFDEWLRQYPRKKAKEAARRAYERVLRRGLATREELLAGAMRYAAEQTGRDPKFTKFPASWLNGGCWQDETDERVAPLPRAPPCATASGARVDPVQQWLEGRRSRDDEEFEHEQDRAASFRG